MLQFKVVDVWIEGTMPLLQHRFGEYAEASVPGGENGKGQIRSAMPGESDTARQEAEKVCYRSKDGWLYMPSTCIARLLREQGGTMKAKGTRKSLKYIVPAAVLMPQEFIELYLSDRKTRLADFEVDSRPVTIPATKGRVMRHRPKLPLWTAHFQLRIKPDLLTEATVRDLLEGGGACIGIGDYRPEKGGPFGTFDIVSWQVLETAPKEKRPLKIAAS